MKIYRGVRTPTDCFVHVSDTKKLDMGEGAWTELPWRLDLVNHSPTGLEWGYPGSGPAQCAVAILADYLNDGKLALDLHQSFKRTVVMVLPREGWTLTEMEIEHALRSITGRLITPKTA